MEKLVGELFQFGMVAIILITLLGATVFAKEWKANISIEPGGFFYCGMIGLGFIAFGLLFTCRGFEAVVSIFSK